MIASTYGLGGDADARWVSGLTTGNSEASSLNCQFLDCRPTALEYTLRFACLKQLVDIIALKNALLGVHIEDLMNVLHGRKRNR